MVTDKRQRVKNTQKNTKRDTKKMSRHNINISRQKNKRPRQIFLIYKNLIKKISLMFTIF